jgi:hypothetical protein
MFLHFIEFEFSMYAYFFIVIFMYEYIYLGAPMAQSVCARYLYEYIYLYIYMPIFMQTFLILLAKCLTPFKRLIHAFLILEDIY